MHGLIDHGLIWPIGTIFSGKYIRPVVNGRQMEFVSTNVSEHNVGGLPRDQAAEDV